MEEPPLIFPFLSADDAQEPKLEWMGNKGANLIRLVVEGFTVPPGFIVSAEVGQRFAAGDKSVEGDLRRLISTYLTKLEDATGRRFGDAEKPLLVSVRSGAAVSMPGMMDTVLNLGLTSHLVEGLARQPAMERFAWDTYRRFIQSFAQVVLDLDGDHFEIALEEARFANNVEQDADLPAGTLQKLTYNFLEFVKQETGEEFPQEPYQQLQLATKAVFESWNTPRAQRFRELKGIGHQGGSAAIVQAMVFGNSNEKSCTGVFFTRNPHTGTIEPHGEYLVNAQGEDVVSGFRTPLPLSCGQGQPPSCDGKEEEVPLETLMPDVFQELREIGEKLENSFLDMQEVEFTVENGTLFLLQTRKAKRSVKLNARIVLDMVERGLITREEALKRCSRESIDRSILQRVEQESAGPIWARGLPVFPGAVTGKIALSSQAAFNLAQYDQPSILVRMETDPRDVHGMDASVGILTSRGGATSHAAQVAKSLGKPCITGAKTIKIDAANNICTSNNILLREGDYITIDGATGMAYAGEQKLVRPKPDAAVATVLKWHKEQA